MEEYTRRLQKNLGSDVEIFYCFEKKGCYHLHIRFNPNPNMEFEEYYSERWPKPITFFSLDGPITTFPAISAQSTQIQRIKKSHKKWLKKFKDAGRSTETPLWVEIDEYF